MKAFTAIRDRIWPWCKFRALEAEVKYQRAHEVRATARLNRALARMGYARDGCIERGLRDD